MQHGSNEMHAPGAAGLSGLLSDGVVPRGTVPATSAALRSGPSALLASAAGGLYGFDVVKLLWPRVLPQWDCLPAIAGLGGAISAFRCCFPAWNFIWITFGSFWYWISEHVSGVTV